jgi:hypothetical protein
MYINEADTIVINFPMANNYHIDVIQHSVYNSHYKQ